MNSHKLIESYFYGLTKIFKGYFGDPVQEKLPFQKETHQWLNLFFNSDVLRHVHLEYYKTDKICVLHANAFPDPHVDLPIMGFDLIAIGEKITGLFFDFTPTITKSLILENILKDLKTTFKSQTRPLPDWADFFSENFYCITPDPVELNNILTDISAYISFYLNLSVKKRIEFETNIKTQNNYCIGQQKNDKTFKALSAEIGKESAELFMKKYLFPLIEKS